MALPLELDPDLYRRYPDLAQMSDEELRNHFEHFGRSEGRVATSIESRADFVGLIDRDCAALEIGPFYSPQLKGPRVRYFDVLDQRHLQERAGRLGADTAQVPHIHYVSSIGDLSVVDEKFATVFSAHCVEHQPDLVRHLLQVETLLEPGGRYFLAIPDKRFCFDHFLPESTLSEVVAAAHEKRSAHLFRSVFEHRLMTCHNDSHAHWRNEHGPRPEPDAEGLRGVQDEWVAADGNYIDVHAWQFTPESFCSIIERTRRLRLHHFVVERVYSTVTSNIEFFSVLYLTMGEGQSRSLMT